MATITIDDTTLHYERAGDGPAMVFVHGMCGNADVWAEQAGRLSDRHTCVRYDRRGHTRSARGTAAISVARHADDAARLIEALDLAPCLLVGSSSGAVIACDLALRHRHLLRAVVVSEPPLFSLDPEGGRRLLADIVPAIEEAIARAGPRAGVDAFFERVCPGLWARCDDAAKDRYRDNAAIGFEDLRSPSLQVDAHDLAAVELPVLVISGTDSHPVFRTIGRRLAAALPDARLIELEGSGHVTYAEQPDAFFRAVSAFTTELSEQHA